MSTVDLIDAIRADIKRELREEILAELAPEIKRRLHANVFTLNEACEYLKVSDTTLRRMVRDGEVPYFRQRGNLYFRQVDLEKHISRQVKQNERA